MEVPIFQEGVSRNRVRGKPPMSARHAKALIEGGPGGSLVTFCPHRK